MSEPALAAYFAEADGWDRNRIEQFRRSERRAWLVAVGAALCALVTTVALLCLMPLKRTEPFLIRVDNTTGTVDTVPIYVGTASMDEAVTRYFLLHYVTTCERFNYATAESDYEECGAFHSAQRNQAWYALWNPNNPASPLNTHKDGSVVSAQIESISFFRRGSGVTDLAQVRYLKSQQQPGGAAAGITHWIASIQYAYGKPSQDPRVRRWNPLGFKVLGFTTEPEVLKESATVATGSAP